MLAVPFGVASAVVYGASIVVQHRVARQHAGDTGASAAGLMRMARSPIWLLAIGGDVLGFLFQIAALSLGQVVVIQPLVVLMLPVALFVSYLFGGPKPVFGDYLGVAGVLGGLAVFLALIGSPHAGRVPSPHLLGVAILGVFAVGVVFAFAVTGRGGVLRGAMYGGVAGAFFGTHAVLIDAASDRVSRGGVTALVTSPRGLVILGGIALLGISGIILTQLSFQVGELGATLPANLAADPLAGVILGAVLLREHVPLTPGHVVAYALCLAAVVAGAIRLAAPATSGCEPDEPDPGPAGCEPAEATSEPSLTTAHSHPAPRDRSDA